MRLAAIDIGTNSIHMIIVQVRPDLSFETVDREKDMVRLGAGGLDGRALTEGAMSTALQTLSKFRRLADSHQVDEIVTTATSAVREAENGGDFLTQIGQRAGLRVKVISGVEEARLIHLAACYGVDVGGHRVVVVDIGGGSVEITLGTARRIRLARSFKVGVIRLAGGFGESDPLSERDQRRLVRHVNRQIGRYVDQIVGLGFERVVGTSGTILSLGALASADSGTSDLRNRRVGVKPLRRLRKELVASTLGERLKLPGLDPRRADLAVVGSVLLDTILKRLRTKELVLCDLALREGLVLDYIRSNRARIAQVSRYPDVRRRSVIELAERCNYRAEHSQQVARIALSLFDQTRSAHGLTDREREWLEYAALLHDIGVHISYDRHHRHSYYLIKHGDLRGFEPLEIEAMALIARYHRRATPKKSHEGYGTLSGLGRRAVKALGAILRLAEGLDRSHAQLVSRVQLRERPDGIFVHLEATGDAELEVWAAQRHAYPLEQVLSKPLRFEVTERPYAEQPDDPAHVSRQAVRGGGHRRVRQDHAARSAR